MINGRQKGNDGARASAAAIGGSRRGLGLLCLALVAAMASPAQDEQTSASKVRFKVLVNVDTPPYGSNSPLAQGTDGNLYGTTALGGVSNPSCGSFGCGTVYRMTPAGALTTIYNFCSQPNCADGLGPSGLGTLALGADGNLYGVTVGGGASGNGTIFKITSGGVLTTIYNLGPADGSFNFNGLVLGADGNFYGAMVSGGAYGNGTVFKVTPQGAFATLYSFCSQTNCSDGGGPFATPVWGADGNLYGMTTSGGANGSGTVYSLTPSGTLTTLHSFNGTDGYFGITMVQPPDGNLYGVTQNGGTGGGFGGVFFRTTTSGTYTVLYNFCSLANCADGDLTQGLVYGDDGNFYGTALGGGNMVAPECTSGGFFGCGTLFKITPAGVLTTLHVFNGITDGAVEQTLVQATNGIFYGTDDSGGTYNDGTVWALSAGLRPFIETLPTSGKVGDAIQILGTDLTGATSVSFNNIAAAFAVVSTTLISATVPTGATTGLVKVTTPTRTLKSNVKFRVR
jgi:uncharacterized repeat protein (TIGR03803 family)